MIGSGWNSIYNIYEVEVIDIYFYIYIYYNMHVFLILIGCWVSGTHCGIPSSKRARTAALLNARGDGRCVFDGILRHYVLATLYRWFAEARLAADEPHAQKQQSNSDLKHDEVIEIFRLSSFVETRLQSIYLFDMTAKHRYRSSQTTGLQFHRDMATPHMDLTDVYAASWERIITSFWLLKMCSCQSRFCQLQPTSRSLPPVRCQVVLGWDWHPCRNHHRIVPPQQANAKHTGMSTYNKFTCWWLTSKLQTCASFFHVPNSDEDQINWARKLLFFSHTLSETQQSASEFLPCTFDRHRVKVLLLHPLSLLEVPGWGMVWWSRSFLPFLWCWRRWHVSSWWHYCWCRWCTSRFWRLTSCRGWSCSPHWWWLTSCRFRPHCRLNWRPKMPHWWCCRHCCTCLNGPCTCILQSNGTHLKP